jgi:uncharacterized protein YfdQ (DUF2303 family)
MDSQAIELIQNTAIDAHKANRLDEMHTPAFIAGEKVVSLEHLQEGRSRFRGSYTSNSLESFADYVKSHASSASGFVDADKMSARVFFNLGDKTAPGHGDWIATLQLKPTPEYAAMLAINGRKLEQRAMVEWIEDWASFLQPIDSNGTEIAPSKALTAIRKLTIKATSESTHQDKDFGARRSAIEDVEATADEGIPYALSFAAVPYTGLSRRTFTLRLGVLTGGDKPQLVLRPVALESAVDAIADEFRRTLGALIGESATLHIGIFNP